MNSCQSHKFYKFCTFSAIKAYVTRRSTNMIITTVIHTYCNVRVYSSFGLHVRLDCCVP